MRSTLERHGARRKGERSVVSSWVCLEFFKPWGLIDFQVPHRRRLTTLTLRDSKVHQTPLSSWWPQFSRSTDPIGLSKACRSWRAIISGLAISPYFLASASTWKSRTVIPCFNNSSLAFSLSRVCAFRLLLSWMMMGWPRRVLGAPFAPRGVELDA